MEDVGPGKHARVGRVLVGMAEEVFATVSRDDFWARVSGDSEEVSGKG